MLGCLFVFRSVHLADEPIARKLEPPGDDGNGHRPTPPPIDLLIRFHPLSRDVEVIGAVDDRVLCYGMLEMARAMIDSIFLKAEIAEERSRIIPASGPLPPFPRR